MAEIKIGDVTVRLIGETIVEKYIQANGDDTLNGLVRMCRSTDTVDVAIWAANSGYIGEDDIENNALRCAIKLAMVENLKGRVKNWESLKSEAEKNFKLAIRG